ncbi:DUF397 domain-containing protein [Actinomadura sp. K4S16]|uniref:DUF397 domain-containing protein n=1 Tax=Actinomadura sp. K4S16 TaxID=1316147 RepID=UPI0011EED5D1|nr:DUF397 domain-containing protein [Actinomadura sp. K4S16]
MSGSGSDCVELACVEHAVLLRDSKDRQGHQIRVNRSEFRRFLAHIKEGAHDL